MNTNQEPRRGDALTHPNHAHFIHIESTLRDLHNGTFLVNTLPGYVCFVKRDPEFDNPSRRAWRFVASNGMSTSYAD